MSSKVYVQLLLTVVVVASAQHTAKLNKSVYQLVVPLGSSVTLECDMKCTRREVGIKWTLTRSPENVSIPVCQNLSAKRSMDNDAVCLISNVTQYDSGVYFCEFNCEIPTISRMRSFGTKLIIAPQTSVDNTTKLSPDAASPTDEPTKDQWKVWVISGGTCLAVKLLFIVFLLFRRRQQRLIEWQCPIYANAHPVTMKQPLQPSKRPGLGSTGAVNLKVASSTQNLRSSSPDASRSRREAGGRRVQ